MQHLLLYSTLGCHLCELAEEQLLPWVARGGIEITVVDIAESADLIAAYGTRIPVLHHCASRAELNWPFAAAELADFFHQNP